MSGWIKLHRGWRDCPALRGPSSRKDAWVWLIENACWKPTPFDLNGRTITLERGQLCVSRTQLAKEWGWSPSAVERFFTRLKTEQMIGQDTGQARRVVTICNYDKYQAQDRECGQATGQQTGQPADSQRTAKEEGKKERREERVSKDTLAQPLPFDEFWKAYPLRKAKVAARKAFDAAVKRDGLDAVLNGCKRYAEHLEINPPENKRFLPHPATWLNRGSYDDELENNDGRHTQPMGRNGGHSAPQYRHDPAWERLKELHADVERNGWGDETIQSDEGGDLRDGYPLALPKRH